MQPFLNKLSTAVTSLESALDLTKNDKTHNLRKDTNSKVKEYHTKIQTLFNNLKVDKSFLKTKEDITTTLQDSLKYIKAQASRGFAQPSIATRAKSAFGKKTSFHDCLLCCKKHIQDLEKVFSSQSSQLSKIYGSNNSKILAPPSEIQTRPLVPTSAVQDRKKEAKAAFYSENSSIFAISNYEQLNRDLCLACAEGSIEHVATLIEKGANVNENLLFSYPGSLGNGNIKPITPLISAVLATNPTNQKFIIDLLIKKDADINFMAVRTDTGTKVTALDLCTDTTLKEYLIATHGAQTALQIGMGIAPRKM